MTIKEVTNLLEEIAPLQNAEDFDNVGLLVGDPHNEIQGILVSLDTLEDVVDEAISKDCNLIVSFHPIIFKGLTHINGKNYVERTVLKAIKNNIAIYSMHTALDNSIVGVSAKMAEVLKLKNTKILIPKKGDIKKLTTYVPTDKANVVRKSLFDAGAGSIGNYDECSFNYEGVGTFRGNENSSPTIGEKGKQHQENEICVQVIFQSIKEKSVLRSLFESHPYEEVAYEIVTTENENQEVGMGMIGELEKEMLEKDFLEYAKKVFGTPWIRHSKFLEKTIKKVAVLGGSGSFAIKNAIREEADVYLSADFKYHDFFLAENNIVLFDVGHYESEQFTKNLLVDYLRKKITSFAPAFPVNKVLLSETNTNPIYYS